MSKKISKTLINTKKNPKTLSKTKIISKDNKSPNDENFISDLKSENNHKTTEYMSIYEYAMIIEARALQLDMNDTPKINIYDNDSKTYDSLSIAREELNKRLLSDLIIRRYLSDGSYDDHMVNEMVFPKL